MRDHAIRIVVSACLLGENVRYDGIAKPCPPVRDLLAVRVELLPLCPETAVGMSVPREPVDLIGDPTAPRMIGVDSGEDWTDRINAWIERSLDELVSIGVHGFVLKSRSPSCGVDTAAVYGSIGGGSRPGDGLLAAAIRRRFPGLPLIEDEDLTTEADVTEFLARVARSAAGGSADPGP